MTLNLKINIWTEALLACSIACLVLILPSIVSDELMNGTQSGKFFFFTYSLLGILILWSVGLLFKKELNFHFTIIDLLLALFVGWVSLNKYLLHDVHALSLRYFELLGLSILYIVLRSINQKFHTFLLVAICIAGLVQAIYGNLQLWGYYPSHHGLFKMTGSFFNPGPFAGFLCCVFPIALGLYWRFNHKGREEQIQSIKNQVSGIKTKSLIVNPQLLIVNLKSLIHNLQPVILKNLSLLTLLSILLVLPAARSRAAWLGALAGCAFIVWHKYNLKQFFKQARQTAKQSNMSEANFKPSNGIAIKLFKRVITFRNRTIVAILALLLLAGSLSLYYFKKDSADGRMLIWTVTANIIKDYPLLGVGQDMFKAHYMNYQADYFRNHPNSKYEQVADDNQYAFNEFLNTWAENGLIGFLLFIGIVAVVFLSPINHKGHEIVINHQGHKEHEVKYEVDESQLTIVNLNPENITKASILAIFVFGLFAYPSEILPTKIIATVCLALLAGTAMPFFKTKENFLVPFANKPLRPLWLTPLCTFKTFRFSFKNMPLRSLCPLWLKLSFLILTIAIMGLVAPRVGNLQNAYKTWNDAFELYNYGLYSECLEDYQKAYPLLQRNGEFMINYGKALSIDEKHKEAIEILGEAKNYQNNTVLCTAMGDSQKALKQYINAEKNYWQASNMAPGKFYPQYLLARLYDETEQQKKAKEIASCLLVKNFKVKSDAIDSMLREMNKIIENCSDSK